VTITIPNIITIIRIILTPIFVIYLITDRFLLALTVFVIAALSDGADGLIARIFNQKSNLGAVLDPLADKILLVAAFVGLAARGFLPVWLTVVVISRDVLILLGALILFLNGTDFKVKPSILSKITTCLQLGAVFMVLSEKHFQFVSPFNEMLYWSVGFFTISSGLHYIHYWFKMMGEGSFSQ
jgi:cardiolipin synthase